MDSTMDYLDPAIRTLLAVVLAQASTPDGDPQPDDWDARRAGIRATATALGETLAQVRERTGRDLLTASEIIQACDTLVRHYCILRDQTPPSTLLNTRRYYEQMVLGIIWVQVICSQRPDQEFPRILSANNL